MAKGSNPFRPAYSPRYQEECTIATTPKKIHEKYYDILGHELVPEHKILSDDESEKLLKRYNIKPEQLPWILSTDPVILSIGAKPGQIVKVVRKSKTAKYATAYRIVIESEKN